MPDGEDVAPLLPVRLGPQSEEVNALRREAEAVVRALLIELRDGTLTWDRTLLRLGLLYGLWRCMEAVERQARLRVEG